ncbi:MAG TPA: sulfate adenylyltransferase, partial [Thermoleophilia bacterium]|nr:sulfate adenylyltransferase [Thermoleophilia bacterium]
MPQTPLGGALIDRVLAGDALGAVLERVPRLPTLMVDREAEISFEMIATGVFSPLVGAPSKEENESIVET